METAVLPNTALTFTIITYKLDKSGDGCGKTPCCGTCVVQRHTYRRTAHAHVQTCGQKLLRAGTFILLTSLVHYVYLLRILPKVVFSVRRW